MSEQITEQPTETARQRRDRERAEAAAAAAAEQNTEQTEQTSPLMSEDRTELARYVVTLTADELSEQSADLPPEQKTVLGSLTAEELSEARAINAIDDTYTGGDLRAQSQPVRARKPKQLAMDRIARRVYAEWVEGGRQVLWQKMPVITYFLDAEAVKERKSLIEKACKSVTPEPFEKDGETFTPSGVRARFGNVFVLSEKMAEKIGKPDEAGKSVLAWCAIDKRNTASNGNTE